MKRYETQLMFFLVTLILLFSMAACKSDHFGVHVITVPDTEENLAGTYKLTYFTSKPKDAGQDVEPTDMIKEKGVSAYMIIKDDGTGYYAYKDNDKSWVRSIRLTYTYDEDDSSKVKELRYTDGMGAKDTERYPGTGKEVLGVTFTKKEKKLHYNQPAILSVKQSTVVTYEKVNSDTNVSYIMSKLNIIANVAPFELSGLSTVVMSGYGDSYPYIYYILSFNAAGKVDEYYQLKTGEPVVNSGLNVEVVAPTGTDNTIAIKIGEKTYTRPYSYSDGLSRVLYITYPATETEPERFESLYSDGRPVSEIIAEATEWYQQSQAQ